MIKVWNYECIYLMRRLDSKLWVSISVELFRCPITAFKTRCIKIFLYMKYWVYLFWHHVSNTCSNHRWYIVGMSPFILHAFLKTICGWKKFISSSWNERWPQKETSFNLSFGNAANSCGNTIFLRCLLFRILFMTSFHNLIVCTDYWLVEYCSE